MIQPALTRKRPPRIVAISRADEESDDLIFDVSLTFEACSTDVARSRLNFITAIVAQLGGSMDFGDSTDFDVPIFEGEPA